MVSILAGFQRKLCFAHSLHLMVWKNWETGFHKRGLVVLFIVDVFTPVAVVELVPSEKRSLYGTSINYGFIAGMLVSFLIGRLRLDWRYTQLAIMVPTTVLLTFFP